LVRSHGEYLIGAGGVYLPVVGTYFLVEGGRDGPDAVAAVDGGFKTERVHGKKGKASLRKSAILSSMPNGRPE
jgi:hypothetical protein